MLIAIMGETFEQVLQQSQIANLTEILDIISEQGNVFRSVSKDNFLFIVEANNDGNTGSGWQGKFAMLLKVYEDGSQELQRGMDLKIKQLTKGSIENKLSLKKLEQGMNVKFKDLSLKLEDFGLKIS